MNAGKAAESVELDDRIDVRIVLTERMNTLTRETWQLNQLDRG